MARILVIDDDPDARRFATVTLEFEGHEVVEVADGRFALLELRGGDAFDAVVLDLMMPWVDGSGVLDRLDDSDPPIVVFSALDSVEGPGAHRVVRHLQKPVSPQQLVDAIDHALDGCRKGIR